MIPLSMALGIAGDVDLAHPDALSARAFAIIADTQNFLAAMIDNARRGRLGPH